MKPTPEAIPYVERDAGRATKPAPAPKLDGYSIYKTDYPSPVFIFDRLLAIGLTILAGRPKSGKSWLTLQMAICAALKLAFLRRFEIEIAMNVLYLGLEEGPARTHNRLRIQLQNIEFLYTLKPLAEGGAPWNSMVFSSRDSSGWS